MKTVGSVQLKSIWRLSIYSIVIFSLLKPDSLSYIGLSWLDSLLIVFDAFIFISLGLLLLGGKYKISIISICIIFIFMALSLSTIIVSHDYFTLIKIAGPATAICLFTDYAMQRRPKEYLKASLVLLCTLYTLNFITILLYYPKGMYRTDYVIGDTYLMGFDNNMIYNMLPMCCYAYLYSYISKKRIFSKISIFATGLMIISEIYVKSGSGVIQSAILVLLVICINRKCFIHIIKPIYVFVFFYIGTYLITIWRIQNYFADFIVGVLGKDVTMTGRTYLWDYAISVIKSNPIIGIGASERTVLGVNGHLYPHPHCLLLDFVYKGGILMLICFFILTFVFIYKYKQACSTIVRKIILITLFAFLIGEMVNSTQYKIFFWATFVLIGYVNKIELLQRKNNN